MKKAEPRDMKMLSEVSTIFVAQSPGGTLSIIPAQLGSSATGMPNLSLMSAGGVPTNPFSNIPTGWCQATAQG